MHKALKFNQLFSPIEIMVLWTTCKVKNNNMQCEKQILWIEM